MKLHDALDDILGSRSKVRIIRLLVGRPKAEFTEREIAGEVGMSPNTINIALGSLRTTDVLCFRHAGRTHSYSVNERSLLFPILKDLFREERGLVEGLVALLRERLAPYGTAIIFGSFAREEERPGSDVDLLVVTERKREALEALTRIASEMAGKYLVTLSFLVMTNKELYTRREKAYVREALNDGLEVTGDIGRLRREIYRPGQKGPESNGSKLPSKGR